MFRKFYILTMATVFVGLAAAFIWPRSEYTAAYVIGIYAVAFGVWATIWPSATKQAFAEGQATEWSRHRVETSPIFAMRLLGIGFFAVGLFVIYVVSFCPSYRAACMGPFAALGFGI